MIRSTFQMLVVAIVASASHGQAYFTEGFDNVGPTEGAGPQNLINQGWIFRNQSDAPGTTNWRQGNSWTPPYYSPHAGAGYLLNTSSWDAGNRRIGAWAILPPIAELQPGDIVSLYISGGMALNCLLEIRYSPSGGTDTGSDWNHVGDFTEVLGADQAFGQFSNWILVTGEIPAGTAAGGSGRNQRAASLGRIALRWVNPEMINFQSPYIRLDTLTVGPPPCNAPPIPAAGQKAEWTVADSPYRICGNTTIPAGATVNVQPGVTVNFDAGFKLTVNGTLRMLGEQGAEVRFNHPSNFPPMIEIINGTLEGEYAVIRGQVRVGSGATVAMTDSEFIGGGGDNNGMLLTNSLPSALPFITLERCVFSSSEATLSDAFVVLRDNHFSTTSCWVLRGYADITAPNTFVAGGSMRIIREESTQPFFIDGINATGSSATPGLRLSGGNYMIGPNTVLQNNLYPVSVGGGILRGSTLPTTGNINNAIDVAGGSFSGRGTWSNLGLPYRMTELTTDLPGGDLTVEPGVVVEAAHPAAAMRFRSTRHGTFKGLPDAPITFRGQSWSGFMFAVNSSTGCRMEHCIVENANFGVTSSDNFLYVDSCDFIGNNVGANMNTFGGIDFRNTRFINNAVGVSMSNLGSPGLNSALMPNWFQGNGAGIDAFNSGSSGDARNCWWGHASGPQAPANPAGQGDAIVGIGAGNVQFSPFRDVPPDLASTPPVVRMMSPGLTQLYGAPDYSHPDFLLDQGKRYIVHWNVDSDSAITAQRIEFSPDGHYPSDFYTLAASIPPDARSWEIEIPDPGFATTNQPQFLRVVAVDELGQEGADHFPVLVPSGNITGTLTITTNLDGQTFVGGQSIPDMQWTGAVNGNIRPLVVLESDGDAVLGLMGGSFFLKFPMVSTDRARLALQVKNNSNDVQWFFADEYFSIRHDPRFGFVPPSVEISSPSGGQSFAGGSVVPITWTAEAEEGLHSFDIQASYNGGRTWHLIARDLPGTAMSYNWQLPPSNGIDDVRVRVIVRDVRFQNSSSTSGPFSLKEASGCVLADFNCDGAVDGADLLILLSAWGTCANPDGCPADLNEDGVVDGADLLILLANWG